MLKKQLEAIVGRKNVSTRSSELYCYSFDASQVKGHPDAVVRPHNSEQVASIVRLAADLELPVIARGAGSGLCGGAVPVNGGIVLDMSSMDRIVEIDLDNLQVTVEPGVVHAKLNEALSPYGFFFPPDPGSTAMCTIGGLMANNGSGMRSVKYGTTRNYVLDLEVVMADGKIVRTGSRTLKTASGYDLTDLMIGSEGTLGIITQAVIRMHPLPRARSVILASFGNTALAGKTVVKILSAGIIPSACEIFDSTAIETVRRYDPTVELPDAGAILLIEVDGMESAVKEEADTVGKVCSDLASAIKVASTADESSRLWNARRLVGAAISRIDPKRTRVYVGEDIGVPIKELPGMLEYVRSLSEEFNIPIMTYGHIGDGNLHTGMTIDMLDENAMEHVNTVADRIYRRVIDVGGTVSAEHGVGRARAGYMELEHPTSMYVMRQIKNALDPQGILNPGKMGL
ncbi:FAD-binding protein [Methanococcoides orientis]|uniref:FAD-binding oxidoreductase n=1 Tax=Methanococcoides orientis TaxID=2822137 RepID=UPI001E4803AB|nr:FAD-linked oxidase C-terminal domain-containing protein [Methanococcoides orientis]UGV40430.1 FAD-binding protein [Methanococcoides orientis]